MAGNVVSVSLALLLMLNSLNPRSQKPLDIKTIIEKLQKKNQIFQIVWSVECGVWNEMYTVWSVKCEALSVEC